MPPKPKEQVKGSGAEWYNIDFDPEILKKGAVVASSKVLKGEYTQIMYLTEESLATVWLITLCMMYRSNLT